MDVLVLNMNGNDIFKYLPQDIKELTTNKSQMCLKKLYLMIRQRMLLTTKQLYGYIILSHPGPDTN
jgi:hypothetical protein